MTLTEFLLARIAEDEALAVEPGDDWVAPYDESLRWYRADSGEPDMLVIHTARVLAECEAKRRIIETLALPYIAERRRLMNGQPSWGDEHPDLLLLLALPYADHPDYDEEWRP